MAFSSAFFVFLLLSYGTAMNGHWKPDHFIVGMNSMDNYGPIREPIPEDGISGSYTGFWSQNSSSPLYDWYIITQTGNNVAVTCQSNCGWSSGVGTINGNQIALSLDSSVKLNGVILTGNSNECGWTDAMSGGPRPPPYQPNCTVINWDNGSSWVLLQSISTVHMIFMNHLDVGYNGIPLTGFINNILNIYFHEYYPRAISVAQTLKSLGLPQTLVYTTHAWLVSLYLNCPPNFVLAGIQLQCPDSSEQAAFEQAVRDGVITWHRGPFNLQPENMDATLFEAGLSISTELDNYFGLPMKTTLSQRDVPGMSRGVIPLLVRNGATAISVGVNGATCAAYVPKAFIWRDEASGTEVIAMSHSGGYPNNPGTDAAGAGGLSRPDCVVIPGYPEALCWAFRTDNSGPPMDVDEVLNNFAVAQSQFPGANVIASTFDNFVNKLSSFKSLLPVVTQEIGDIWMQGIASDPLKMAQNRAMIRQVSSCLHQNQCSMSDPVIANVTRWLIKPPEHTWGLPSIGCCDETAQWSNDVFHQARLTQQDYKDSESSWYEQRVFNDFALQALQLANNSLYYSIKAELDSMKPQLPSTSGYKQTDPSQVFTCGGAIIGFDGGNGAITRLQHQSTGREWASQDSPLAKLVYSTYDENAFAYVCDYVLGGKPDSNKYGAQTKDYTPNFKSLWQSTTQCSFLVETSLPADTVSTYGGAPDLWLQVDISSQSSNVVLNLTYQWFSKTSTRFAESYMLYFTPTTQTNYKWAMDKLGSAVDPKDVINGGSQRQHALWNGFKYYDSTNTKSTYNFSQIAATNVSGILFSSPDVPLVSPVTSQVKATPLTVDVSSLPGDMQGMAFNLYNNVWNTNYIMWYPYVDGDEDAKFRFQVTMS